MIEDETRLLILQATPRCNINCSYCYLPDRDRRDQMSVATVRAAIRALEDSHLNRGAVTLAWHAGEPLVLPVAYYRDAFAAVREEQRSHPIELTIQTNAIAVTDAWCELFSEFDVRIGVSLDGPPDLHDAHRLTRSGEGTHALTLRGLKKLQQWGFDPYVIAVVTSATVRRSAREFFEYFVDAGVRNLCLNFEEIEGVNTSSSLQEEGAETHLAAFLNELRDLIEQRPFLEIREFKSARAAIVARERGSSALTSPFGTISVNWRGEFSTFCPELLGQTHPRYGAFVFGSVHDGPFLRARVNERFLRTERDIADGVAMCRAECEYFEGCLGGAPSNKLAEHGTFACTETLACRVRRKLVLDIESTRYIASQSGLTPT